MCVSKTPISGKLFNASIIAIHRNGKQVPGKVGEMTLAGGDFLLLLAREDRENGNHERDLFFVSVPQKIAPPKSKWLKWVGVGAFAALILRNYRCTATCSMFV